MNKEYETILNRLIKTVETLPDSVEWSQPWIDAGGEYPFSARRIKTAEEFFNSYYKREKITYMEQEQNRSFYAPDAEIIMLPLMEQFINTEVYYSVKAHETIHSTGDYTRLYREGFDEYKAISFGSSKYSREELTAEIGSIYLLHALGINTASAERDACIYIKKWSGMLNYNYKWMFDASALAEDAVGYILGEEV